MLTDLDCAFKNIVGQASGHCELQSYFLHCSVNAQTFLCPAVADRGGARLLKVAT